jgi:hypothetical protein
LNVEEASCTSERLKRADMLTDLNAEYFGFFDHRSRSELVAA